RPRDTKGTSGRVPRSDEARRRRPEGADREPGGGGERALVPPPDASRQDRHPACRARQQAQERQERAGPGRRRPSQRDPLAQGCTGSRVSHVYCSECGYQNSEAANFCARCGAMLEREGPEAERTISYTPEQLSEEGPPGEEGVVEGPALVVRSGGGRSGESFALQGGETTIG